MEMQLISICCKGFREGESKQKAGFSTSVKSYSAVLFLQMRRLEQHASLSETFVLPLITDNALNDVMTSPG